MPCRATPKKRIPSTPQVFSPPHGVVSPSIIVNEKGEYISWTSTSTDGIQLKHILEGPSPDCNFTAAQMKTTHPLLFDKYATKMLNSALQNMQWTEQDQCKSNTQAT
eukprot:8376378-Ditylum_brightwellii.AAC.1